MTDTGGSRDVLDRVASAISEALAAENRQLVDGQAMIAARAAIDALREPTKEMILAGEQSLEEFTESDFDSGADGDSYHTYTYMRSGHMRAAFQAMIAAALQT